MAQKIKAGFEPSKVVVGHVVSYDLFKRTPSGPQAVTLGTIAVDSQYDQGSYRSAISLMEYITKSAIEEAFKDPDFIENQGDNAEDFFVVIRHHFNV